MSRLLVPPEAPRDVWLAHRMDGVTASEIPAVMGISPFASAFDLYWRKCGVLSGDFDSDRLSLGRHLEPWVADRFAEAHPEFAVSLAGLFGSDARPWQLATPDRLLYDAGRRGLLVDEPIAVWEGKTDATYQGWGEDGTDIVPTYIRAQVLWQMDVMGVPVGYVSCLFLASQQTRHYVISYDAADVAAMRDGAARFLKRLDEGDPPPLDDHRATTAALQQLYPAVDEDEQITVSAELAAEYRAACAEQKRAEQRQAEAANRLRAALGEGKRAIDPAGITVATRSVYDRTGVDAKRLRAERPDVFAEYRTSSRVDQLRAPVASTRASTPESNTTRDEP